MLLTKFPKILGSIASVFITLHHRFPPQVSYLLTVYFSIMNLEQSVKDLQDQNAQFQDLILNLSKGQDELKTLLTKKEKKTKKPKGVINLGRRFKGRPKKAAETGIPKDEEEEEEGDDLSVKNNQGSHVGSDGQEEEEEEDEYPQDEDYADEKYRLLEERLRSVEIQKVPGLDFEELGFVPGVVIPPKFKTPAFAKYDGVSSPKMHLRSYVRKIQPHTADKRLWIHFFQESLSGTQLEWYYQLEGASIRTWEDLVVAFYRQYQYNFDLAPTHMQLQSMSMGPKESFKEYAQNWRDLAGRVQPSLTDRELVDMFMGMLTGPFYSHLLGSSSSGFTDLILTGEHVENGIGSGKIQVGSASGTTRKPYQGRNESNAIHSQKSRGKEDQNQSVGAVLISAPTSQQVPRQDYQRKTDRPRRQFTKISMPLSQVLQHLLKANLITVRDPPKNVTTTSPSYDPKAKCVYHSSSPGHATDNCWALRNKVQDMLEAGEIEFDAPETPNVITAPMPKHDHTVNAIMDTIHVYDVTDLSTPLPDIKRELLRAGLFPGCDPDCYYCASLHNGCENLKRGIQGWMDRGTIRFEKTPTVEELCEGFSRGLKFEDVSMISKTPLKIPTKAPLRISTEPRVAPIIITQPGPIPYSSDKAIPWSYGAEVFVQGVKQELEYDKVSENDNPDVGNIAGTSKVTRSGRVFSPEISPNVTSPAVTITPNADVHGKGPLHEPETVTRNTPSEETNEFLKYIRKSDYDIVEQMGHTPSKISMLSLLSCSKTHAKAMMKFLEAAHVPQEISVTQFENCMANLTTDNYLGFSDADLSPSGRNHNKALHISIECGGTTLAHVLVDDGSSLNVLPKVVLDRLKVDRIELKSSNVIVKAYDGTMSTVYGEVELPIRVGAQTFNTVFYVMDIRPAYSCLLGRPWIHGANAGTSTLHQKVKYPTKG